MENTTKTDTAAIAGSQSCGSVLRSRYLKQLKIKYMYRIKGWCPIPEMNGAGFAIVLKPEIKEAVRKSGIKQENVDFWINTAGRKYLKYHGYNIADDASVNFYIRISWGEWGIEHITVPGNACGLDLGSGTCFVNEGEKVLQPHNVDNLKQASLLLAVFVAFAEILEPHVSD